jgi:adenylate kinase
MIIIVTGTPGTGKTTIAKKLAKSLNHTYLDVNHLARFYNICESYDEVNECAVIDTKNLNKILIDQIAQNDKLVIDSHLSHYLPKKYVDVCIVSKCDITELKQRLKKRGYHEQKIRDNLDSEIFDVCLTEAQEEYGHNVIVVDTTEGYKIESIIKKIQDKHISLSDKHTK